MTEQEITKQLKEILPNLVNLKEKVDKIEGLAASKEEQEKQMIDLKKQLENVEGNITDLGKKYIELGNKRIAVKNSGLTNEEKIDFAKFIVNVYKNYYNPSEAKVKRIAEIQMKYNMPESKAALNEGTDAQGGYGVPDPFMGMIWREAEQESIILRGATIMPLTRGYKLPIISKSTGVSIAWEDEAAAFNESEPTFGKSSTDAKKMAAYSLMSNELLEDEEFEPGLTDYVIQLFSEAMASEIDVQGFEGSGSPFTGLLNESGTNTVTMSAGDGEFADISFDYLSDMIAQIKPGSLRNAKWYMHRTIVNYLRKKKGNDQYFWKQVSANDPATIHGYPLVNVEEMPTSSESAVSTEFVVFGNLKNFVVGTKGDMKVQVGRELKMLNDQTVLAVKRRIAMKTAIPNTFAVLKTNAST